MKVYEALQSLETLSNQLSHVRSTLCHLGFSARDSIEEDVLLKLKTIDRLLDEAKASILFAGYMDGAIVPVRE